MNKRTSLLSQFAIIFILFALVTTLTSAVVTYFTQMQTYKELCWNTIEQVGDYLTNLILKEGEDFIDYTDYYRDHYKELRIPKDFDEYQTARAEFVAAYTHAFPDQTLYSDVPVSELPDELQLLYYTYRHEYWLLTFEQARESFGLPYTYFLTMNEAESTNTYVIDGERTEDPDHPGYLYMGDTYYEDPATHELLWTTWATGEKQDGVYEWNNDWGNTYSCYTPLVIDGRKLGLVVAEIDVADVNRDILNNSVKLGIRIAGIFFISILIILFIINSGYITKLHYLADKIESYGKNRDTNVVSDLRSYSFGNNEIGMLADETAGMISEIETHEDEIQKAAQMKTDFLANMSHEIRTPMNAVIGMAEMALREKLPDAARNYVGQIKSSGRILLTIINDILDFSKIESGKMDIVSGEYAPISLLNDVSNIIMMRLSSKDVDLDLDIPPDLPAMLNGDSVRIRQILINLANNAVKFTERGYVGIRVSFDRIDDITILLKIAVEDTGVGIREEDLNRIFESFSQVDSKRNRSVEGTGLGLAISQRLISLMGGTLDVQSVYGKGSTFTFTVPQTVVEWSPALSIKRQKEYIGVSLFDDSRLNDSFKRDSCDLGVISYEFPAETDLLPRFNDLILKYPGCTYFLFTRESLLTPDRVDYLASQPDIVVVTVSDFSERSDVTLPNLVHVRKPLSAMNISMVYNREGIYFDEGKHEDEGDFTAPEASVLIVDDNAVNLAVAEGLLEPLGMVIMTADSGQESIELAGRHDFDIILMDHMMPEMDGIEATHLIRKEYPAYKDIPIIALTANAIGDAREKFLEAGLDDFIPKPIEVKTLVAKIREWLPPEKIVPLSESAKTPATRSGSEKNSASVMPAGTSSSTPAPVIGDLDTENAIRMIGSEKVFNNVLKEYHRVMEAKADAIRTAYNAKDWAAYTIEVHALKSSSRQIGATGLADMAADLEAAGKELNTEYIQEHTDAMLERYLAYKDVLDPLFDTPSHDTGASSKPAASADFLKEQFNAIRSAAEELDLDSLESAMEAMEEYGFTDEQNALFEKLKEAVGNIDPDTCVEIVSEWEKLT